MIDDKQIHEMPTTLGVIGPFFVEDLGDDTVTVKGYLSMGIQECYIIKI